jgi:hypothetical protein
MPTALCAPLLMYTLYYTLYFVKSKLYIIIMGTV